MQNSREQLFDLGTKLVGVGVVIDYIIGQTPLGVQGILRLFPSVQLRLRPSPVPPQTFQTNRSIGVYEHDPIAHSVHPGFD